MPEPLDLGLVTLQNALAGPYPVATIVPIVRADARRAACAGIASSARAPKGASPR